MLSWKIAISSYATLELNERYDDSEILYVITPKNHPMQ